MKSIAFLKKRTLLSLLVLLQLILTGCAVNSDEQLSGIVTIWHGWSAEEAAVLDQILSGFSDLHPDVTARGVAIEPELLKQRFEMAAEAGLGPDLILGPSSWIKGLADEGLIRPADDLISPQLWERFLPSVLETVRYENALYGVPESIKISGLYYNQKLVDNPPQTLSELLNQAKQGQRVGMSQTFSDAFWGIQAFGGQLFDEDGRVVLDDGGLANWLDWLRSTADEPNIVFDKNMQTLVNLFAEGKLAYLVASSQLRNELDELIGIENLGVAPLPSGPIGDAGPIVETNTLMFSVASSEGQRQAASQLASFIATAEQQTILMRQAKRIPANIRVRNNPTIDPIAHAFRSQSLSGVPLSNDRNMAALFELGEDAFNRALQGIEESTVVAQSLTEEINEINGYVAVQRQEEVCRSTGVLTVGVEDGLRELDIIRSISDNFEAACPASSVTLMRLPIVSSEQLVAAATNSTLDLLLVSNEWIVPLSASDLLQPLNGFLSQQQLQAYQPSGIETMRFDDQLYGLPFTLSPQALYINTDLTDETAIDLATIQSQGQEGMQMAIPSNFVDAYWGMSAFGSELIVSDDQLSIDRDGLIDWLEWLIAAKSSAGLILDTDVDSLRTQFIAGDISYLIDRPQTLAILEETIGPALTVAQLPAGPEGDPSPLLTSTGFVMMNDILDEQKQLAISFASYATNGESQAQLMRDGRLLPANISVTIDPLDRLALFSEQADLSTPFPNLFQMVMLVEEGNQIYRRLLSDSPYIELNAERLVQRLDTIIDLVHNDESEEENGE